MIVNRVRLRYGFTVAFVLFSIVKPVNRVREQSKEYNAERAKKMLTKEDKKLLKAKGIKLSNKVAVAVYVEEKLKKAAEEAEKKKRRRGKGGGRQACQPDYRRPSEADTCRNEKGRHITDLTRL